MVELIKTSVDFNDLVLELEADLQTRDSFKALFPGETSKIFTEHGAGITALMLYNIHSAAQNAFFPTAFSKQAVYALATSLGNPPRRKLGAQLTLSVTVQTNITSALTLPKFSRFSGRGLEWFTIEDQIIPISPPGQVLTFEVRQGQRITETFTGTGNDNQRVEIGEDFNIDENYLTVKVGTTVFTKNGSSLLNAEQGDTIYAEQTSSNGRVLILFGNQIIGSIPTLGDTITISYSNTVGLTSNSSITGDKFQYLDLYPVLSGYLSLSGVVTTTASGGSNEESVEQVKNTAPKLYAANKRAVRRDDYVGHILSFTGSSAAKAWGEYEEASQKGYADLTMMNRAYITAIPSILNNINSIIGTGNGVTTGFSLSTTTNLVPGSVIVSSNTANWYDTDGKGLLLSSEVEFDVVFGGVASASENNGTASQAWNNNPANYWQSVTAPTVFNPIRISYDFGGSPRSIRSVRIKSSNDPSLTDRGFPKTIIILGSTVVSPSLTSRDDWVVLRGSTLLDEPGYNAFSKWIPVDNILNGTLYQHIAIEILDSYGSSVTKISDISVQQHSDSSLVNYDSGTVTLNYNLAPTGNITLDCYNGNFSTLQKQNIVDSLKNLNHFTTLINFRNSVAVVVDINIDIYYLAGFEPNTVLSDVQNSINSLFTINGTSIGKALYISDIYQAIQDVASVDYSIVRSPTKDYLIEIDQFVLLNSTSINIYPTNR